MYEVLAPGFQSPLTKTQIAELFQAGRLGRDHRCKQVAQKEWRTIDELFPLLKYQSVAFAYDEAPESAEDVRRWHLIFGLVVALSALVALWYYFGNHSAPSSNRGQVTETRWPRTTTSSSYHAFVPPRAKAHPQEPASQDLNSAASRAELPNIPSTTAAQLAEQRRQAAEQQRHAEQVRPQEERARQEEKARGQDAIIELDRYHIVNVGGSPVHVKIHDNDVTSFDVWINGFHRRQVRKEKGINQSRTDETLIYDNGRARLYYVWELSGKLGSCRLRVRET